MNFFAVLVVFYKIRKFNDSRTKDPLQLHPSNEIDDRQPSRWIAEHAWMKLI